MKTEKQATTTHTPTPWKTTGLLNMDLSEGLKIENKDTIVAEICGGIPFDEALGNAAFIVRAVNSHGALLEAAEHLIDISDRPEDMFDEEGEPTEEWNRVVGKFKAIARAAKGE